MATKKVLISVGVPDGKYCCEYSGDRQICDHFDNEGGHPTCALSGITGFRITYEQETKDGILKADDCNKALQLTELLSKIHGLL